LAEEEEAEEVALAVEERAEDVVIVDSLVVVVDDENKSPCEVASALELAERQTWSYTQSSGLSAYHWSFLQLANVPPRAPPRIAPIRMAVTRATVAPNANGFNP
jgi:hypothetical protein